MSHIMRRITFAMLLIGLVGCSSAYHCYPGCYVNCRYAAPAPLPYSTYDPACHSYQAEPYLFPVMPTATAMDQNAKTDDADDPPKPAADPADEEKPDAEAAPEDSQEPILPGREIDTIEFLERK